MKKYDCEIEDAFKMFSAFCEKLLIEPIGPSIYKQQVQPVVQVTVATVRDQPRISEAQHERSSFLTQKNPRQNPD